MLIISVKINTHDHLCGSCISLALSNIYKLWDISTELGTVYSQVNNIVEGIGYEEVRTT